MDFFKESILEDIENLIDKVELDSGNIGKVASKRFMVSLRKVRKDIKNQKFSYAEKRRNEKEYIRTFGKHNPKTDNLIANDNMFFSDDRF